MTELCGHPTKSGKPCNMTKNHNANFHRHREYPTPISWVVRDSNKEVAVGYQGLEYYILEEGIGREELGYAITRSMRKSSNLVIEITVHSPAAVAD